MKHTTQDLLLAATVQQLTEARLSALVPAGLTALDESKWREANLEEQAHAVMAQLSMYADIIRDFTKQSATAK